MNLSLLQQLQYRQNSLKLLIYPVCCMPSCENPTTQWWAWALPESMTAWQD